MLLQKAVHAGELIHSLVWYNTGNAITQKTAAPNFRAQ